MSANADALDYEGSENQHDTQSKEFLTIVIAGQRFGIPILQVQDVLGEQTVTKIPLAPPEVAGSLNLRGRIVTAIDMRCRLGIEPCSKTTSSTMGVVVEHENELYSLIIDEVGDVLRLRNESFESTPSTLDSLWREISSGVYRLDDELLVILDVPNFVSSVHS
ncbi:MAG TPA: chemotaxis protein CheW [Alphaproteobacteria bacterium]|nr:chemotaxis protein CheW [Alphaproteobacteria bacterium]USO04720.1 MAG: chemotaxis protein CheW [Rhodospirillales bacterium]HOO82066.1 chemotaxis protein CheW [Alphaproteobacteria bacterium]